MQEMGYRYPYLLLLPVILLIATAQPPPNCRRSCKGVDLPYPFGIIGDPDGCYMLPDFGFTCDNSSNTPIYRNNSKRVPVVGIVLPLARMRVLMNISLDCYNSSGRNLDAWNMTMEGSPYTMSSTQNVFTAVGCDTSAKILIGNSNNYGGCISGCNDLTDVDDKQCSGVGCCEASIPSGVKWYEATFMERDNSSKVTQFNNCSYSFLVEKNNYTFHSSDITSISTATMLPLVLEWVVGNQSCAEAAKSKSGYTCVSGNSICVDSVNGGGYYCNCSSGYEGNPYLVGGCQDIDECQDGELYPCHGTCINTAGGYNCTCPDGFNSTDPTKQECTATSRSTNQRLPLGAKLVIGIGSGLFSLFIVISVIYLGMQKRKLKKLRDMFFQQNGGTFLQQSLLSHHRSTFKIFTIDELKRATNNFHKDHIIGRGGFGIVYGGAVADGTMIAVKKSSIIDEKKSREFANEMFIISQINHKNIVKLLGCCLEVEVPMLIYEYISNGTLFNYLHNRVGRVMPIPFGNRLKIATEAAQALKYLHADASPPILHGDVKSSNILLDETYTAKVSDFGTSTLAPKDKSQFTTLVQGTYGYLDPEYLQTSQLTDKSDVYSFGVVLVELLTRKTPFNFNGPEAERSLAFSFISCMNENRLLDILDAEIVQDGITSQIQSVAKLALRCLSIKGKDRPTMRDIVMELEGMEGIAVHPWLSPNQERVDLITNTSIDSYDVSEAYDIQTGR